MRRLAYEAVEPDILCGGQLGRHLEIRLSVGGLEKGPASQILRFAQDDKIETSEIE